MNYIVHVSERFNCVYIQTPKVACTTIKKTMQAMELGDERLQEIDNPHDRETSPLKLLSTTSRSYENLFLDETMFRFTFVRNPYTRIASTYLDKFAEGRPQRGEFMRKLGVDPRRSLGFENFLQLVRKQNPQRMNKHWMPLALLVQPDRFNYSFIGRFERFSEDLNTVVRQVYGRSYDDGRHRANQHATGAEAQIRSLIGPLEQEIILEIYEDDFNLFDYSRNIADDVS